MIQPGDEILVKAKVEAIHGRDLLVNVAGHNLQISENDIIKRPTPVGTITDPWKDPFTYDA